MSVLRIVGRTTAVLFAALTIFYIYAWVRYGGHALDPEELG